MMNQKSLERRVKKNILAGEHELFFSVIPGLEEPAETELRNWGLSPEREKEPGSLSALSSLENIWKTVLMARCPSRVYLRLLSFKAEGFREFRNKTLGFPWELYLSEGCEFRIRFSLSHCRLHVTDNIGKSLLRSIRDRFMELEGKSPSLIQDSSPHVEAKVQTLLIRGVEDRFQISLDAGGGPLYDRGYRQYVNEAPLRETLAASLLQALGINRDSTLIDPMCGSGTFSLEAAGMTAGLPAFGAKQFPFEFWPSFRPARYAWLIKELGEQVKTPCSIFSSDLEKKALSAAEKNSRFLSDLWNKDFQASGRENFLNNLIFTQSDFFSLHPPATGSDRVLILNPPYGMRLHLEDRMDFFRNIGKKIREDFKGCRWGIITPGLDAEKALGLHWEKKYLFKNGGLPVSFLTGKS